MIKQYLLLFGAASLDQWKSDLFTIGIILVFAYVLFSGMKKHFKKMDNKKY